MPPTRIALTGGIATGKTHVGRILRAEGLPTVEADAAARDVVAPGTPGLALVLARFGQDLQQPDGRLDRAALARIVFGDAMARRELERIVHPLVRVAIDRFFEGLPTDGLGVAEIPLAYESGWAAAFDTVVVVACRPETQRARLSARDGFDASATDQRLAAQWPIADKVRLADAVVMTDGSLDDTERQAVALAAWLKSRRRP